MRLNRTHAPSRQANPKALHISPIPPSAQTTPVIPHADITVVPSSGSQGREGTGRPSPVLIVKAAAELFGQVAAEPLADRGVGLLPRVEHALAAVAVHFAREHGEEVAADDELGGGSV